LFCPLVSSYLLFLKKGRKDERSEKRQEKEKEKERRQLLTNLYSIKNDDYI